MPEQVVDFLEVIQVDAKNGEGAAGILRKAASMWQGGRRMRRDWADRSRRSCDARYLTFCSARLRSVTSNATETSPALP
jgi:hypothetical protein